MILTETRLTGDLLGALDRFERDIQEKVAFAGVAAMAAVLYEEARAHVPVYQGPPKKGVTPGQLRDAIYRAFIPEKSDATRKVYRISWNRAKAPHGHLVEFGTSRSAAQPFIRPAFDRIGDAMDAGLARMAEKLSEIQGGGE